MGVADLSAGLRRPRAAMLGTVLALLLVPPAPAARGDEAAIATAKQLSAAFAAVAARVTPAVVNISSSRVEQGRRLPVSPLFRELLPELDEMFVQPRREVVGLGSGVIIRPDGYIVTNSHVIEGAQQITVTLADETEHEGHLVGEDPFTDVAVIRIDTDNLPAVPFATSGSLQVGEWVIAVGSPLGLAQTVTAGIVSATGRKDIGLAGYEDFIQTDAAINPGNSGGALVNLDGELVGINTAIASEGGGYDGVCFAVPAAVVFPVTDVLIREGKIVRPFLGITPKTVDRRLAQRLGLSEPRGVLVQNMIRQGPAHRAGLRPGDVLIQWGERAVQDRTELVNEVQATEIGSETTVIIVRESKQYRATVTVSERPQTAQLRGVL